MAVFHGMYIDGGFTLPFYKVRVVCMHTSMCMSKGFSPWSGRAMLLLPFDVAQRVS